MIGIFHGRGITERARVFAQIDVDLRQHLHEFNNGKNSNSLSVFLCLALHVDRHRVAKPGIEAIMRETGYSRGVVCNALDELETLGLVTKLSTCRGTDPYQLEGYAWFGARPAPSLWEERAGGAAKPDSRPRRSAHSPVSEP